MNALLQNPFEDLSVGLVPFTTGNVAASALRPPLLVGAATPIPRLDYFAVPATMNPEAKATEGKAGMAVVTDHVRRSTAGTGLRVGEAVAVLPATTEVMVVTARRDEQLFHSSTGGVEGHANSAVSRKVRSANGKTKPNLRSEPMTRGYVMHCIDGHEEVSREPNGVVGFESHPVETTGLSSLLDELKSLAGMKARPVRKSLLTYPVLHPRSIEDLAFDMEVGMADLVDDTFGHRMPAFLSNPSQPYLRALRTA